MVDLFEAMSDRFRVVRDDMTAFDTEAPSIQLFDDLAITLNDVVVTFPNMLSAPVYRQGNTFSGGATACDSWSGLLPQEWGPGYGNFSPTATDYLADHDPPRRELAATTLGTVPAGTDYLDVRARIVRTTTPPVFRGISSPLMFFPSNEWINLPGGSCPAEFYPPMIRLFEIVQSGTSVVLNRYQSTYNSPSQVTDTTGGNVNNQNTTQIGSAWGNYTNAPVYWAMPAYLYDTKGPDGSGNKRAPWGTTSTNSCAVGGVVDYTSTYSVDLIITPGVYKT